MFTLYLLIGFCIALHESYQAHKEGQKEVSFYIFMIIVLTIIWGPLWLVSKFEDYMRR